MTSPCEPHDIVACSPRTEETVPRMRTVFGVERFELVKLWRCSGRMRGVERDIVRGVALILLKRLKTLLPDYQLKRCIS